MKAKKISQTTRRDIAQYRKKNPRSTVAAIAEKFGVTPRQVQYALDLAEQGALGRKKTMQGDTKKLNDALEKSITELFEEQALYTMSQLSAIDEISPLDRSRTIERVARARKTNLDAETQANLHGVDWQIFVSTVKRFMPDATKKQIVQIFNEERDRCINNTAV